MISHQGFNFSAGGVTHIPTGYQIIHKPLSSLTVVPVAVSSLYFSGQEGSECNQNEPRLLVFPTYNNLCGLPDEYLVLPVVGPEMQIQVIQAITDTLGFLIRYQGKFSHLHSTAGVHSSN